MHGPPGFCRCVVIVALVVGCASKEHEPPLEEAVGQTTVVRPEGRLRIAPGVPVALEWVSTVSGSATVDLFADGDGDPETTSDQLPLTLGNTMSAAPTVFDWQTAKVPLGTYRVFARMTDREGTHISLAPGVVEVVEPLLTVENLQEGAWLRYPLALLSGSVPAETSTVSAGRRDEPARAWPALAGRFKTLVRLVPGANDVLLEAGGVLHRFSVNHEPMTNPRFVRFIYVLPADGDGRFDAPAGEPNDVASALRRIGTAAELMQTFMAEALEAQGLGRRTFHIARDRSGVPLVETFRSRLTTAQARAMVDVDVWSHLYGELESLPARASSIDVVIMSMTHFDPAQGKVFAHTALGGGRLALFGSGGLHTWAESLDQVPARFLDERRIDKSRLFDDSAGRGTHWANYATGVGATLHELGHCLSLPHPADGKGVMSRAFDYFNRTFMVEERASDNSPALAPVRPEHETGWDRSGAVRLGFHRWLAPIHVDHALTALPEMSETETLVTLSSRAGVRHIAWSVNHDVVAHDEFLDVPPSSVSRTKSELRQRFPGAATLGVSVIDNDGNIGELPIGLGE